LLAEIEDVEEVPACADRRETRTIIAANPLRCKDTLISRIDVCLDYSRIPLHTPEQFGQPADLHPDTLPELIRTASRFIFGQF